QAFAHHVLHGRRARRQTSARRRRIPARAGPLCARAEGAAARGGDPQNDGASSAAARTEGPRHDREGHEGRSGHLRSGDRHRPLNGGEAGGAARGDPVCDGQRRTRRERWAADERATWEAAAAYRTGTDYEVSSYNYVLESNEPMRKLCFYLLVLST